MYPRGFVVFCLVCGLLCAGSAYGSSRFMFMDQGDLVRRLPKDLAGKPSCADCINVVEQVDKAMEDPAKQAKIGALITVEVCAKLPESARAKCVLYAPVLVPAVIAAIEKDLPPSKLCALVELCPPINASMMLATTTPHAVPLPTVQQSSSSSSKASPLSFAFAPSSASIMDQVALAAAIIARPTRRAAEASEGGRSYPTDGGPRADKGTTLTGIDGTAATADDGTRAVAAGARADPDVCSLCTAAAEGLQRLIESRGGEDAVIDDGLRACDALPGPIRDGCTSLVTTYLAQAVAMLTSMSPHECCTAVEACRGDEFASLDDNGADRDVFAGMMGDGDYKDASSGAFAGSNKGSDDQSSDDGASYYSDSEEQQQQEQEEDMKEEVKEVENILVQGVTAARRASVPRGDDCDVCKLVVQSVDDKLADPNTQATFFAILKAKCATVPQFADQCVEIVDMYGPVILAQLVQALQPDVFCADAGICKLAAAPTMMDAL
eukprot:jgi/Mesvir1/4893/Mv11160-RA.1